MVEMKILFSYECNMQQLRPHMQILHVLPPVLSTMQHTKVYHNINFITLKRACYKLLHEKFSWKYRNENHDDNH